MSSTSARAVTSSRAGGARKPGTDDPDRRKKAAPTAKTIAAQSKAPEAEPEAVDGAEKVALRDRFNHLADEVTSALGSFWALAASVLVVIVWGLTGPIFHFSDTWQLFINTTTTVVTFWMVFVIQNSANRDAKAVHLKLDELIRAMEGARNTFITLENAPEDVVAERAEELAAVATEAGDDAEVEVTVARRSPADGRVRRTRAVHRARARRTPESGRGGQR